MLDGADPPDYATPDPMFLVLTAIAALGFLLTLTSVLLDRKSS